MHAHRHAQTDTHAHARWLSAVRAWLAAPCGCLLVQPSGIAVWVAPCETERRGVAPPYVGILGPPVSVPAAAVAASCTKRHSASPLYGRTAVTAVTAAGHELSPVCRCLYGPRARSSTGCLRRGRCVCAAKPEASVAPLFEISVWRPYRRHACTHLSGGVACALPKARDISIKLSIRRSTIQIHFDRDCPSDPYAR
jgi:hypothetical protein